MAHVSIAGGETTISTIGNSPKDRVVNCQTQGIWHILSGVLTVLVQGHLVIVFWWSTPGGTKQEGWGRQR